MRSKSNRILRSLAVSDALIGYIMFPLLSYQAFHPKYLRDCTQQNIRQFLLYTLVGASAFTVALISYDRYILLTKLWHYDKHIGHSKVTLLICISWLIPIVGVILDLIAKVLNIVELLYVTKVVKVITITLVLVLIAFFYQHILRSIKKTEKQLRKTSRALPVRRTPSLRRYVLAKQVSVLVTCHIVCFVPTLIGGILWYSKCCHGMTETSGFHGYLLFATFIACFNSCINPVIYASRYQEFRKCLKKLVYTKFKQETKLRSVTSNNRLAIIMPSIHNRVDVQIEKSKGDKIPPAQEEENMKDDHRSQFATTPLDDNVESFEKDIKNSFDDDIDNSLENVLKIHVDDDIKNSLENVPNNTLNNNVNMIDKKNSLQKTLDDKAISHIENDGYSDSDDEATKNKTTECSKSNDIEKIENGSNS